MSLPPFLFLFLLSSFPPSLLRSLASCLATYLGVANARNIHHEEAALGLVIHEEVIKLLRLPRALGDVGEVLPVAHLERGREGGREGRKDGGRGGVGGQAGEREGGRKEGRKGRRKGGRRVAMLMTDVPCLEGWISLHWSGR